MWICNVVAELSSVTKKFVMKFLRQFFFQVQRIVNSKTNLKISKFCYKNVLQ